ncbi:MAG TPA: murein L,D-transpeptidase catalytic domain family protein [Chitinophagaceae bacterium]|nr:murein L,D-transpeptidase catalytic domain family protein [Chitinophagaceae bacterium]
MKKKLKGFYLLLSSLFITLLHLPSAFAKPVPGKLSHKPAILSTSSPDDSLRLITTHFKSVYDSLHLDLSGLSRQAFLYAQKGWTKLVKQGKIINSSVMAIIDYSQSSDQKRLYIIDMKNYKLLFHTLVAHGRNSGKEWASSFSNKPSSYKSSPGFYITGDTYFGSNGYSLKLNGIEKGINDKALKRAIVMHGAGYVDESYIDGQGYIGRSQGCPAVPVDEANDIIDAIKNGACLFIYPGNKTYISRSPVLRH